MVTAFQTQSCCNPDKCTVQQAECHWLFHDLTGFQILAPNERQREKLQTAKTSTHKKANNTKNDQVDQNLLNHFDCYTWVDPKLSLNVNIRKSHVANQDDTRCCLLKTLRRVLGAQSLYRYVWEHAFCMCTFIYHNYWPTHVCMIQTHGRVDASKQLTYDAVWYKFSVWCICVCERGQIF